MPGDLPAGAMPGSGACSPAACLTLRYSPAAQRPAQHLPSLARPRRQEHAKGGLNSVSGSVPEAPPLRYNLPFHFCAVWRVATHLHAWIGLYAEKRHGHLLLKSPSDPAQQLARAHVYSLTFCAGRGGSLVTAVGIPSRRPQPGSSCSVCNLPIRLATTASARGDHTTRFPHGG